MALKESMHPPLELDSGINCKRNEEGGRQFISFFDALVSGPLPATLIDRDRECVISGGRVCRAKCLLPAGGGAGGATASGVGRATHTGRRRRKR